MAKFFEKVKISKPGRSNFDLSHSVKTTLDFGKLVPFTCLEVLPGDTFKVLSEIFMRVSPMLAPIMQHIDVYTHYFFVPNRLIYDKWEDFITGGSKGDEFPNMPKLVVDRNASPGSGFDEYLGPGSLWDYFGLPIVRNLNDYNKLKGLKISQLPFRAYQLIFNEYYRDQNIVDDEEVPVIKDNVDYDMSTASPSNNVLNLLTMRYRAYEKDYFTSALPWAQRGPDVHLPIYGDGDIRYEPNGEASKIVYPDGEPMDMYGEGLYSGGVGPFPAHQLVVGAPDSGHSSGANIDNSEQLKVDFTNLHAASINEFRKAFSLQKFLEKNARVGGRYTEQLLAHFGVKASDSRLQRPEYLGGGVQPIQIGEVVQTSETTQNSDLGEMAGRGVSAGFTNKFKRYFEEHGYVLGIMSIIPKASYFQGVSRMWSRQDRYDYYFPEFAHLGEQEILNKELYQSGNSIEDNKVFGYTPRYAEYKYIPNRITGEFRDTLDYWHLGRKFGATPTLSRQFIEVRPSDNDRIFAVSSEDGLHTDHFWCEIYNKINAKRCMPYYGTPSF